MITMKLLNGDILIKHIQEKQNGYNRRREDARATGDLQRVNDYQNRSMVIDHLLIRIFRGDFDVKPEDEQPENTGANEKV
jgi:hypothetical protein